ncbi:hypothetical protein MLD38_019471 [Melastoma candidum]|uniref:Uncharacterized protein n=1 Tax=Melastoma candidum TaxID=119954 RepID=A0ACB9R151_9MYRT|nr:hypothetical protein MLD38_019471 [Melastoma candidum]
MRELTLVNENGRSRWKERIRYVLPSLPTGCIPRPPSQTVYPRRPEQYGKMAIFAATIPCRSLRGFSISASSSSNGAPPHVDMTRQAGAGGGPVILELPLDKIRRPLMRTRANDPNKVQELMDSIRLIGLQVPIDVLEVEGVYYGFSGCHRYEAHQRLGLPTIRCKIRKGTKETLRHHLR